MAGEQITVAGVQISQVVGNREANISKATAAITAAYGHDIYVLPELSSSGYGVEVFRALEDLAEDVKGPSYRAFSDLARRQRCFNSSYIMSTNWAGPDNGGTAFCPPFLDGEKCRLESIGKSPGVLSGIVDIRYLEEVRRTYPYLTDRNDYMYRADTR